MTPWTPQQLQEFSRLEWRYNSEKLCRKFQKLPRQIKHATICLELQRKIYKRKTGKNLPTSAWSTRIFCKNKSFLQRELEKVKGGIMRNNMQILKTPTLGEIHKMLTMCHSKQLLGLVQGVSGSGKTTALRSWCARHDDSLYLEIMDDTYSRKMVLYSIIDALGGQALAGNLQELKRQVIDLISYRRIKIIIVDQANYLKSDRFNMLNAIREITQIGFILAGTEKLAATLKYGARSLELEQLSSRIDCAVATRKLTSGAVFAFMKTVLSVPDTAEMREVAQEIFRKSQNRGQMRTLFTILERARDVAEKNGSQNVTAAHLIKSMEYII